VTKGRNESGKKKRFASETIELPRLLVPNAPVDPRAVLGPPPARPLQTGRVGPSEVERKVVFEPLFTRRPYDLSYACLLIPRFGAHRLRGDVVPFVRDTMYQICVSFGWRLDFIMIRPEFLQYVVSAPASTPPARSIRLIREMTSKRILEDYPHFREENLGSDFWAAPYLVLVGSTPHTPESIIEFIRATRREQGFLPHRAQ